MKKILLFSAILIGAASASQAGVRLDFGIPLPPLPGISIRPPVVVTRPPQVCEGPSVYYDYDYSYGYRWHPRYERDYRWHDRRDWDRHNGHRDWDNHQRGGGHDDHHHR